MPVDGAHLAVTYSPGRGTAVVALHGASAGTRNFRLYEHLHAVLPAIGLGVATFDRRGEGGSSGAPSRGSFEVQARDALAVADSLDIDRIGLWGFSQGGWVAPLAAVMSRRVEFLVLIASTGVTPAEQMRYAVAEQVRRAGFGQEAALRAVNLRRRYEAWVHESGDVSGSGLERELRRASHEPWWEYAFLPTDLPDAAGRASWISEMDFDPVPIFAATAVPALLFYGADDGWTPVASSLAAWRQARGDGVEVVVIPDASHDLSLQGARLSPMYEHRLVGWLRSRLSE